MSASVPLTPCPDCGLRVGAPDLAAHRGSLRCQRAALTRAARVNGMAPLLRPPMEVARAFLVASGWTHLQADELVHLRPQHRSHVPLAAGWLVVLLESCATRLPDCRGCSSGSLRRTEHPELRKLLRVLEWMLVHAEDRERFRVLAALGGWDAVAALVP